MNEIDRWSQDGNALLLSRAERAFRRTAEQITTEARVVALAIDADAAIADRVMDRIADLDRGRHQRADGDATLNAAMIEVEAAFIASAARRQQQFSGGFVL